MTFRLSGMNRSNYLFNSSRMPLRENQAYHESWYYTTQRVESGRCIDPPALIKRENSTETLSP